MHFHRIIQQGIINVSIPFNRVKVCKHEVRDKLSSLIMSQSPSIGSRFVNRVFNKAGDVMINGLSQSPSIGSRFVNFKLQVYQDLALLKSQSPSIGSRFVNIEFKYSISKNPIAGLNPLQSGQGL